jgi:hypothetical protein
MKTMRLRCLAAGLVAAIALGIGVPQAEAVVPAGKPIGGCALLGPAQASAFLGGAAQVVSESNEKGHGATVLSRGCSYSSADKIIDYTANTLSSATMAKYVFNAASKSTKVSNDHLNLMGADNVKIAGQPGFARIHRAVPGPGEVAPANEFYYQVVVRKGATIFTANYAANDLDSMKRLYTVAKTVVARM